MIILRNRTTSAYLRYKRNIINPYTKRTPISKYINMDSSNNQQKKEVCSVFITHLFPMTFPD
jgi:hypothetical protein